VVEAEARIDPAGDGAPQVEYRQFVFVLNQCRIQQIREYIYSRTSHWFTRTPADG
jgi:hypothetical protein